ncbi:MAG: DUF4835 family protein [Candidatus Kapaibacterium sp.]|nr:MAG: DUF4835 family protein [Candidatus Kapabacteria bacterium]
MKLFSRNRFILLVVVVATNLLQPASKLAAQELKATVTVNLDQMDVPNERENLSSLQFELQNYLNSQSFTGKEYKSEADKIKWKDEPVVMNFSVFIMSGSQNTGRYNARVIVTAQRPLFGSQQKSVTFQYLDNSWSFLYSRGASPNFQPLRFDELASFLDFFAYIAIGMDMDSYGELAGTPYFQRAQQIVQMGANYSDPSGQNFSSAGYRVNTDNPSMITRAGLVNELLDVRVEPFRRLLAAYYLSGMDYLGDKPDEAKASIDALFTKFADFKDKFPSRSMLMQIFCDAKYREFADLFKGTSKYPKVWEKLKYIDPSHTLPYEQAQKGR